MKPPTLFAFGLLLLSTYVANADVQLHVLFTDDMVLQRDKPVPVWGTAAPDEKVVVSINQQSKSTHADAEGAWRVVLDAMPVAEKLTLSVRGNNQINLKNVAIGEVYLCSGQSNMQRPVNWATNAEAEVAAANYPNIRFFSVPRQVASAPRKDFYQPVAWRVCTPTTALEFSAVAYFFGRELHQRLNVPIGLIHASWGGTIAQTWISRDTLLERDDLRAATLQTEKEVAAEEAKGSYQEQMAKWWQTDKGTTQHWSTPGFGDSAWITIPIPNSLSPSEKTNFEAVVWFRKAVDIPETWDGKDIILHIGEIQHHTAYFNGVEVGSTVTTGRRRAYRIPAKLVRAGRNVIALRVLALNYGFRGVRTQRLEIAADPAQIISLTGDWKHQLSVLLNDAPPPRNLDLDPNHPTLAFNAMIAPLVPFAVRGVIWYQGESNARNPLQYRTLLPNLIRDWRTQWKANQDGSDFGFYFVQLPNYKRRVNDPVPKSAWAKLREAQAMPLSTPRTGMATTIGIGKADDIHPRNKQDVGKRLTLVALAKEYSQNIEYSGPIVNSVRFENGKAHIDFSHNTGLTTTDGQTPRAFAIKSADGEWHHASARIEGESVVLWNDKVLNPVAVRYAWADNPDVNLFNAAGLPVAPFRSDSDK